MPTPHFTTHEILEMKPYQDGIHALLRRQKYDQMRHEARQKLRPRYVHLGRVYQQKIGLAARAWGTLEEYGEPVINLGTGTMNCLEHTLHEMAHAVLLGVVRGPRLPGRIGVAVGQLERPWAVENELETLFVEMAALRALSVPIDEIDFIEGGARQTNERPNHVYERFRGFEGRTYYRAAAQEVVSAFMCVAEDPWTKIKKRERERNARTELSSVERPETIVTSLSISSPAT